MFSEDCILRVVKNWNCVLKAYSYLTHYHTIPHFDALKIHSYGKYCEKRRYCLLKAISRFFTMFSTLYGTYFLFLIHFKMSYAICFNLDQSKILLSGNGLKVLLSTFFPLHKKSDRKMQILYLIS